MRGISVEIRKNFTVTLLFFSLNNQPDALIIQILS